MAKAIEQPTEYIPTVTFYFNKDKKSAKEPENFDDLQIDGNAKVTVSGKVTSIRHDSNSKSFEITIDRVKLILPDSKPMGVSEGLSKIQEARKT
ncbi:MAG: hypothetical protein Q7J15_08060 [Candidatus Desulfaltia sp.]|nr:hypothetical protein [Candidatus Desulfaltia sp.]